MRLSSQNFDDVFLNSNLKVLPRDIIKCKKTTIKRPLRYLRIVIEQLSTLYINGTQINTCVPSSLANKWVKFIYLLCGDLSKSY